MKYDLKKPCRQCPFRRACMPGWLGPDTGAPLDFIAPLRGNEVMPGVWVGDVADMACHVDMDRVVEKHDLDHGDSHQLAQYSAELQHCAGALHFLGSIHKRPRDRAKCEAMDRVEIGTTEPMLTSIEEFENHHSPSFLKKR
jgi:hypothetical protein